MGRGLNIVFLVSIVGVFAFSPSLVAAPSCRLAFSSSESEKPIRILPDLSPDLIPILLRVDSVVARDVTREMQAFVADRFAVDSQPVLGAEYNAIFRYALELAESMGIQVERVRETVGVFPKGLFKVGISGFGLVSDPQRSVSFSHRHELVHLLHVIQVRAILLKSFGARPSPTEEAQINKFLEAFEGGANYREIERMVTAIAGLPHAFSGELSRAGRYRDNILVMLGGIESGMLAGKVKFGSIKGFMGIYSLFMSKAPLVVGSSFKSLAARFSFAAFSVRYAFDPAFRAWVASILVSDDKERNRRNAIRQENHLLGL